MVPLMTFFMAASGVFIVLCCYYSVRDHRLFTSKKNTDAEKAKLFADNVRFFTELQEKEKGIDELASRLVRMEQKARTLSANRKNRQR